MKLFCHVKPPHQSQATFLRGNFSPIATLVFLAEPKTSLVFHRALFLGCGARASPLFCWMHKRRNSLLFQHHVRKTCQRHIIFIKRCFAIAPQVHLIFEVSHDGRKSKTVRLQELKDLSQIEVLQISLNRC